MRVFQIKSLALVLGLLVAAGFVAVCAVPVAYSQSNISGDLAGNVTDPSGAAISNAQVTVTSDARGDAKVVTTDANGNFRVPLLQPGRYKVNIKAQGFETATADANVAAGVISPVSIRLSVGQTSTTIEVTDASTQVLHTDDAQISTSFDLEQIQTLPNPGNDLTFVAQTTPGAVMNTQGGYGNFSVNGLPGTSNTFTVNGGYEGDPYLNLNNSGATNLLLGNNDVSNVTVITNSYDAAFGGLGGAQVSEISRSGTNKWHGNLVYWWNGRATNANSYFNKQNGLPRNFSNVNQWAASIGGPLKKDKVFGFMNTEGLRVIIPNTGQVSAPSPAYQAAILGAAGSADPALAPYGNLADNNNQGEAPLYQAMFKYYTSAPGFKNAQPDLYGDPATVWWTGQSTNFAHEWLITDRVDFNLSDADRLYIHSKVDKGVQPTATSFLSPDFDALSPQPSYEGQLNETHTFSPTLTNQFLFAASYYRAIFTNTNAAKLAQTIPFVLIPEGYASGGSWDAYGGQPNWIGNIDYALPQGRNVTGYQFADDLNLIKGKHNIKFGFAFRRDDITDYTASEHDLNFGGGENIILDQGDFAAGYSDEWVERFPRRLSNPVALYVEGFYGQDQWKPVPNLTLTLGLRVEHNSNPICLTNCVANLAVDFNQSPTAASTPYNKLIASDRRQAFFSQQNLAYEPRFGFAYQPGGPDSKTVIRGGFGMFADYFPAQIMGDLLANMPNVDRFSVLGTAFGNTITVDTADPASGHAQAVASNNALQSLYSQGACYKGCDPSLSLFNATGGLFSRPTFSSVAHHVSLPTYEEWSFAIEREVMKNTAVAVNYIGNRSYHQPVSRLANAFDGDPAGTDGAIASLPATRPNAALGSLTEYYSGSYSNYNGLVTWVTSHHSWVNLQFNYAYGHALDTTSNGGFDGFGVNSAGQINPYNLKQQYGNADYDTRHYVSANYAFTPHTHRMRPLTDDWELAGTIFHNSGYPFSVTDTSGDVAFGNAPLAAQIDNNFNHHCGGGNHTVGASNSTACDFASHFTTATDFGQQGRNQLYGPNYTDFDMDIAKGFQLPHMESARLKIGAQFFNVFNHPNFQIPTFEVRDGGLGTISSMANTPTSILGAFLGGDASPRLIQFKGTITF